MAKKKAEKMESTHDEVWLAERVADGRAVLDNSLSMNAIADPDMRLQQRVEQINMNHVNRLDRMRREGVQMYPAVVFYDPALMKHYLADGFHRWKMHLLAGLETIRAYVIQGTWRDAMLYSVMCNQMAIMQRNTEDIKKAVFTLLDDEEWRGNSDSMIGGHVGLSSSTVGRYRLEHSVTRGVAIPETVETIGGNSTPYKRLSGGRPRITMDPRGWCYANHNGVRLCLGKDIEKAQAAVDDLVKAKAVRKLSLKPGAVRTFLAKRSLLFGVDEIDANIGLGGPSVGHGVVFVADSFIRPIGGGSSPAVPTAVGRVLLARQMIDPAARAVVVCYVEDAPPELIEAGRALGVEFLSPEELVVSIKGEADRESA